MSAKVMGLALEANLPRSEKFILIALADHAKEDGSDVYPSVARIEWKTGYSERQVRTLIDKLEERGILQIVHPGGSGPADVRKYRIILSKIPTLPDFQLWKGAKTAPMVRVQSDTEKGAIPDEKGCNLEQKKGAEIAPESITRTNTEPRTESLSLPLYEISIDEIARTHPRNRKPVATERAICDQLDRLCRKMPVKEAIEYLLNRTQLFAAKVSEWPESEKKFIPDAHNWFLQACFDADEKLWEYHGKVNGNGPENPALTALRKAARRQD